MDPFMDLSIDLPNDMSLLDISTMSVGPDDHRMTLEIAGEQNGGSSEQKDDLNLSDSTDELFALGARTREDEKKWSARPGRRPLSVDEQPVAVAVADEEPAPEQEQVQVQVQPPRGRGRKRKRPADGGKKRKNKRLKQGRKFIFSRAKQWVETSNDHCIDLERPVSGPGTYNILLTDEDGKWGFGDLLVKETKNGYYDFYVTFEDDRNDKKWRLMKSKSNRKMISWKRGNEEAEWKLLDKECAKRFEDAKKKQDEIKEAQAEGKHDAEAPNHEAEVPPPEQQLNPAPADEESFDDYVENDQPPSSPLQQLPQMKEHQAEVPPPEQQLNPAPADEESFDDFVENDQPPSSPLQQLPQMELVNLVSPSPRRPLMFSESEIVDVRDISSDWDTSTGSQTEIESPPARRPLSPLLSPIPGSDGGVVNVPGPPIFSPDANKSGNFSVSKNLSLNLF